MELWPQIPPDVVAWFRSVFAEANHRVCERLVNVPNIRETSLDDGLEPILHRVVAPGRTAPAHKEILICFLAPRGVRRYRAAKAAPGVPAGLAFPKDSK
jgi:hypothetical protein